MPDTSTAPVPTQLHYHARDPYAVQATFRLSGGTSVEWFFARELLAEGLRGPAGIGDVRLSPTRRQGQLMVEVALMPPAGQADLMLPGQEVADFLRRTEALVPPGTERRHLDLDSELSHLLAGH
ncbi:SsgA family sporulation/cell division regulator [Streptomyces sp. AF1A]|jgi:hypothetical protein|uniref:SsgA family sporulation/cell division regulator n=1 Tax=Streptomyces sp. AF1A TaxID=3394350 RepID=UPI0039BC7C16